MIPFLHKWLVHTALFFAGVWRRCMVRTTVIAVTGSLGKTSTKELIAAVLGTSFRTVKTRGSSNHFRGLFWTLLKIRPWHRYAVIEIGLDGPGQMAALAWFARPDVAVWVSVARAHQMTFRSLENTALEKSKLVEALRPGGVAILNDDNSYIASYAPPRHVETVYFGNTERSSYRAEEAVSSWPQRLRFSLVEGGHKTHVDTHLVGKHWVTSVLAAIAVGRLAAVPLEKILKAVAAYEPLSMRMSPVELPNGATILRDERNGSIDSMRAALKVLEDARAERKILVLADVSDSKQKPRERLRDLGLEAARVADAAVFIGDHCEHGAKAAIRGGMREDRVWSFFSVQDAAAHLSKELRKDDLVLLRGRHSDKITRVYLPIVAEVHCWRVTCAKKTDCVKCPQLSKR